MNDRATSSFDVSKMLNLKSTLRTDDRNLHSVDNKISPVRFRMVFDRGELQADAILGIGWDPSHPEIYMWCVKQMWPGAGGHRDIAVARPCMILSVQVFEVTHRCTVYGFLKLQTIQPWRIWACLWVGVSYFALLCLEKCKCRNGLSSALRPCSAVRCSALAICKWNNVGETEPNGRVPFRSQNWSFTAIARSNSTQNGATIILESWEATPDAFYTHRTLQTAVNIYFDQMRQSPCYLIQHPICDLLLESLPSTQYLQWRMFTLCLEHHRWSTYSMYTISHSKLFVGVAASKLRHRKHRWPPERHDHPQNREEDDTTSCLK